MASRASSIGFLGRGAALVSLADAVFASCNERKTLTPARLGARRVFIRSFVIGFAVVLALANDAKHVVQAQTYCAMYNDGSKSCGIPSLDSCRQSVSGVGGYCTPDQTSQMRPDFFGGRGLFPDQQTPAPPNPGPQDPNWMPPPPGQ